MNSAMAEILIVSGAFYADLADALEAGALAEVKAAGHQPVVLRVPGALEIPQAIRYGISTGRFAAYIALGAVIRGETGHYDIVANESSRALMDLALEFQAPIGNGILTVEDDDQAWERADVDQKNKGGDAARAALAMLALKQEWKLA
jgi:6,7-dimethyl-8-ribityllumazine synthase